MSRFKLLGGATFDLLEPDHRLISPEILAHCLSLLCRYGGHVPKHYSVAQHSVIVSYSVPPDFALEGLLHDGCEGLGLGDIISPAKRLLGGVREIERRLDAALCRRFGLIPFRLHHSEVKLADLRALRTEMDDLRGYGPHLGEGEHIDRLPERIKPWRAARARRAFLSRFYELTRTGEVAPISLRIARRLPWMA